MIPFELLLCGLAANRSCFSQKVDLGSVMQKALIENKVEFVQLFLDSGVKLSKFLTIGRLEDLYRGVSLVQIGRASCRERV